MGRPIFKEDNQMRNVTCLFAMIACAAGVPAVAKDCPAAVTSAIERAHSGAKTVTCQEEREEGTILYEARIRTTDGKKLELEIRPDGTILLTEEHIAASALPAAVLQSLHAKYADAAVEEAERLTAPNGDVSFEVVFASGGGKKSITVSEGGVSVEDAADDADDDADGEKDDDEDD